MIRKAYHLRDDQVLFLESLPGTVAEHIRQAVDDYIIKMTPGASKSPSKPT